MAPLIMVALPAVSSLFSTCGCFLRVERSSSEDLPPLSLACGWPLDVNGGASTNLGLKILRVQGKGGQTNAGTRPGRPAWANRPKPIPARLGRSFAPVGSHAFMHFAPFTCTILTMSSSRPRWRFSLHEVWSFTLQSPGNVPL
jgi:hypothetical protein